MKAVKYIFAIICFGLGIAMIVFAVETMNSHTFGPEIGGGLGAMFLLGTFLLLRR